MFARTHKADRMSHSSAKAMVSGKSPMRAAPPTVSALPALPHLGNDFSRTPLQFPEAKAIQTKLAVNAPGDEHEQEAERIAGQVMAQPARSYAGRGAPRIHHYAGHAMAQADSTTTTIDPGLSGSGSPLEPGLLAEMEQRFSHDFSRVRVHSDASADRSTRAVNAHAYTTGSDIVFGASRFAPATHDGRLLLAHELTHVVQQSGADTTHLQRQSPDNTDDSASATGTDELTGTVADTPADGPDALTPYRKKWVDSGRPNMTIKIVSLLSSIQKIKKTRLDTWTANAQIKDPKPVKDALEVALQIVGTALGGVVGGLLTKSIVNVFIQELVDESTAKITTSVTNFIFEHAVTPARETLNAAATKALGSAAKNAGAALVSKGDLLSCYAEAVNLQTISDEAYAVEEFLTTVDTKVPTDVALADEVAVFMALFGKLQSEPEHFLRELSVGFLRLKDEAYLHEQAAKYGGSVKRLLKEDSKIDETDIRSGNLLLIAAGRRPLGHYSDNADVNFGSFYALATEVNNATLEPLSGTAVKDLPLTLAFRFFAYSPFRNLIERVAGLPGSYCKVWFERRSDGTIVVDFDEGFGDDVSDGVEWLASYYMHSVGIPANHNLSLKERQTYAIKGARKLYDLIKGKPVNQLSNFDWR